MARTRSRRATGRGFWWTLAGLMLLLAMAAAFLFWYLSRGPGDDILLIPLTQDPSARELAGTRGGGLFFADENGEASRGRRPPMPP
ncbi:hypothetical protein H8E07_15395, partial [bacterium]|nr:hypothetical protein [bacterium]